MSGDVWVQTRLRLAPGESKQAAHANADQRTVGLDEMFALHGNRRRDVVHHLVLLSANLICLITRPAGNLANL